MSHESMRNAFLAGLEMGESGDIAGFDSWGAAADKYVAGLPPEPTGLVAEVLARFEQMTESQRTDFLETLRSKYCVHCGTEQPKTGRWCQCWNHAYPVDTQGACMTLDSVKEWFASWGDGPHWADSTGKTVPITKESLTHLIKSADKMRTALRELKERALCHAPGAVREFAPATAASIAIICADALEGV